MSGGPRTSIDPRSDAYRRNLDGMRSLLDGLLEAHEAAIDASRVARELIDALLDRDSPFLELSAPAGRLLGIGLVAGVECVVVGDDDHDGEATGEAPLPSVAMRNALPVVQLGSSGDAHLVQRAGRGFTRLTVTGAAHDPRVLRETVRRLAGPAPEPPPAAEPPAFDDDELLAVAPHDGSPLDARVLLARLTDGSRFVEMDTEPRRADAVTGWAEVCGISVGIVAGTPDRAFADHCEDRGVPVVAIGGPIPVLSVRRGGEARLTFAWPRPDGAPDGVDAVIDPRDTRVALGIALAATRPR